jgi:hypothetical protein
MSPAAQHFLNLTSNWRFRHRRCSTAQTCQPCSTVVLFSFASTSLILLLEQHLGEG